MPYPGQISDEWERDDDVGVHAESDETADHQNRHNHGVVDGLAQIFSSSAFAAAGASAIHGRIHCCGVVVQCGDGDGGVILRLRLRRREERGSLDLRDEGIEDGFVGDTLEIVVFAHGHGAKTIVTV